MEDEELDHWPMSYWCDPEHPLHDRLALELLDATSMEDDEMVACLAWLQDPLNRFDEIQRQCTAEDIERLFQEHLIMAYPWWGNIAEQRADVMSGKMLLTKLLAVARRTGHQDAFAEMLAQMGQDIAAETDGGSPYWWFHVATLLDGRVFALKRPNVR